eukprot:scaffold159484_cov45-Prasinocladus_malaysianus.AAC.3
MPVPVSFLPCASRLLRHCAALLPMGQQIRSIPPSLSHRWRDARPLLPIRPGGGLQGDLRSHHGGFQGLRICHARNAG